ncbi:unnamed protein product [Closterium sp. Naga37s-1]|nr:unnamed protein product [Closterium sp. Naga37s-1]
MCAHISGNLLSALQTAGLTLPPQKLTRTGAVPTSADVSEMSGVVRETSSEVQTLKKEVAALRAEQGELQSEFSSVSKQLFERVAALRRQGRQPTPSAGWTSRIGPNEEAAPPQQHQHEPHYAPASTSPATATAQPHQPSVPPGRDAAYYQPGTSRPAPPLRPVAPLQAVPRPSAPIYQGYAPMPPYAPPPGMPFYWQAGPPQHAPPPQQSYPPPAIPSMSGAGEGGGEWMRDAGGEAGAAGGTNDAFTDNPIRMGPFSSEEEAAKGYKAAAVVVRPQGYRIQRSIELTASEQQLLTGCTRQHVASLADRGLWNRWRRWRQLMPELASAPLLHVPHASTNMLPPRPRAVPSSSQATQPPGMGHSRTPCDQQQYLDQQQHYN